MKTSSMERPATRCGRLREVFFVFLRLGLTSFGGPIAHLAYFRHQLVVRRRWMDEASYADLVALCQFLPGPTSSQVGFSLGVLRGNGILGGLAAWTGFTLPSAFILFAFSLSAAHFNGPVADGFLHGLKLVAVAVVAQAIWGMSKSLTPDRQRAAIALTGIAIVTFVGGPFGQILAIAGGTLLGVYFCRSAQNGVADYYSFPVSRLAGVVALAAFALLLIVPPLLAIAQPNHGLAMFDAFYRSGALVFGGGHVVLPLLQAEVVAPGRVSNENFLAGYGLAQAVPGPLFTLAAYLGAVNQPAPTGLAGSAIALMAIFLPGLLLTYGMLPFWYRLRSFPMAQAGMRGANAAVVGILGAALYQPVCTSAVTKPADFFFAILGFLLLITWKVPSWAVVVLLGTIGMISGCI